MISVQEAPKETAVMHFLASLEDEIVVLNDLAQAAAEARVVPPDGTTPNGLHRVLERQAELCFSLEGMRAKRETLLNSNGHSGRDLLVVVLGVLPKEDHPGVVDVFRRYIDAAELTQREIDINQEFFSVALSSLEDTIQEVVCTVSSGDTYNSKGSNSSESVALCVSTVT
ncbi:MAG: hypothetical protein KTR25_07445 [Myxococcales bacterium]|nr:hypothetical protein [Myxococcales bacterium]